MNINATLIAQIIHFFIAYALLSRFFLRPTVALILEEEAYRGALQAEIDSEVDQCVSKENMQKKQWQDMQDAWQKRVPRVSLYEQPASVNAADAQQPSGKQVEQGIRTVATYLKERVNNAL